MDGFETVNDVLDFAIRGEEEASEFYSGLAERMETPRMRKVFEGFAREERGHRAKLLAVREGKHMEPSREGVRDLRIAEYLVEADATPDMDYQQALVVAMKKEKAAFKLYSDLAEQAEDEALRNTFQALAQEEAKHKLRFELEYDDHVLSADL